MLIYIFVLFMSSAESRVLYNNGKERNLEYNNNPVVNVYKRQVSCPPDLLPCDQPLNYNETKNWICDDNCPEGSLCCEDSCFVHRVCKQVTSLESCPDDDLPCAVPFPSSQYRELACEEGQCPKGYSCCQDSCFYFKVCKESRTIDIGSSSTLTTPQTSILPPTTTAMPTIDDTESSGGDDKDNGDTTTESLTTEVIEISTVPQTSPTTLNTTITSTTLHRETSNGDDRDDGTTTTEQTGASITEVIATLTTLAMPVTTLSATVMTIDDIETGSGDDRDDGDDDGSGDVDINNAINIPKLVTTLTTANNAVYFTSEIDEENYDNKSSRNSLSNEEIPSTTEQTVQLTTGITEILATPAVPVSTLNATVIEIPTIDDTETGSGDDQENGDDDDGSGDVDINNVTSIPIVVTTLTTANNDVYFASEVDEENNDNKSSRNSVSSEEIPSTATEQTVSLTTRITEILAISTMPESTLNVTVKPTIDDTETGSGGDQDDDGDDDGSANIDINNATSTPILETTLTTANNAVNFTSEVDEENNDNKAISNSVSSEEIRSTTTKQTVPLVTGITEILATPAVPVSTLNATVIEIPTIDDKETGSGDDQENGDDDDGSGDVEINNATSIPILVTTLTTANNDVYFASEVDEENNDNKSSRNSVSSEEITSTATEQTVSLTTGITEILTISAMPESTLNATVILTIDDTETGRGGDKDDDDYDGSGDADINNATSTPILETTLTTANNAVNFTSEVHEENNDNKSISNSVNSKEIPSTATEQTVPLSTGITEMLTTAAMPVSTLSATVIPIIDDTESGSGDDQDDDEDGSGNADINNATSTPILETANNAVNFTSEVDEENNYNKSNRNLLYLS